MMSTDEIKTVTRVYNHLLETENRPWDGVDEFMDMLGYLNNDELVVEAKLICEDHRNVVVRCPQDHPIENCVVPMLVDASLSIVDLYDETKELHIKNRYILEYYIAMNKSGIIVVGT